MDINELWHSSDPQKWDRALNRYWTFVKAGNLELEKALEELELERIWNLSAAGWYEFLRDEYFRWKYTAPNRYVTTTRQLKRYVDENAQIELFRIKELLLKVDCSDVRSALATACQIRGLGTAGGSGLLALMYPKSFGTVDQFAVKALRTIPDLPERPILVRMKPATLRISDAVVLIDIMRRKAASNNQLFETTDWTPRKIDKVLWTYGRWSKAGQPFPGEGNKPSMCYASDIESRADRTKGI